MSNKKNEYKTLLSVLANGSEDDARKLLKKESGKTADDTEDLEIKLARMYAESPNKIDLERKFAEIHPHKKFIMKYLSTEKESEKKPEEKKIDIIVNTPENKEKIEKIENVEKQNFSGHAPCGNPNCEFCKRYFSEASGNSNACGCSSFNSYSNCEGASTSSKLSDNSAILIIGMVSIVGIVAIVSYLKTNNR